MEFLQPLAVLDVALASAYVVHVAGVDQHYLNAARLEDLVDRDPVDPGRFERHGLDPALHQPLGQALKVGGEGAEFTHRLWIAVTRHRDEMAGRAAVDARGVGLNALQQRGPRMPALLVAELAQGSFNAMVLHLGLLHIGSAQASADRGAMGLSGTLLNGITNGRVTTGTVAAPHGPCSGTGSSHHCEGGLGPRT